MRRNRFSFFFTEKHHLAGAADTSARQPRRIEPRSSDEDQRQVRTCYSRPFSPSLLISGSRRLLTGPGAGFDTLDITYLTSQQIVYANAPQAVAVLTADATIMMILQALRQTTASELSVRGGGWQVGFGQDPHGLTLGVVGVGRIGKRVAQVMESAFGMKVVYSKRTRLPKEGESVLALRFQSPADTLMDFAEEGTLEHVSFDGLLARADVIALCCPLTPETRHLINAEVGSFCRA